MSKKLHDSMDQESSWDDIELKFMQSLDSTQLIWFFEHIPEIVFFTKDLKGHFTSCNEAALNLFGVSHRSDFIGKNDFDFFSQEIAFEYRSVDTIIYNTGKVVKNIIEIIPNNKGDFNWKTTTKIPVFNPSHHCIGVAVIVKVLSAEGIVLGPYNEMMPTIDYIFKNYSRQIKIEELTDISRFSLRQLERNFKKLFNLTPLEYINKHRVTIACTKLYDTRDDILTIAKNVGFNDLSHFNKTFKSFKGMTPNKFRKHIEKGDLSI